MSHDDPSANSIEREMELFDANSDSTHISDSTTLVYNGGIPPNSPVSQNSGSTNSVLPDREIFELCSNFRIGLDNLSAETKFVYRKAIRRLQQAVLESYVDVINAYLDLLRNFEGSRIES